MPLETQRPAPKRSFPNPRNWWDQKWKKKFALKPSSHYHFQLELHMFVSELTFNVLVVWTTKGIFTVEVPYNPSFMFDSCAKLKNFWKSQVPFTMAEITRTVFPGISVGFSLFFLNAETIIIVWYKDARQSMETSGLTSRYGQDSSEKSYDDKNRSDSICKTYEPLLMITFVEVLLWSHHCKVNTLFANSYLCQLVWRKKTIRFNKDYWDQNLRRK